ncbi:hypothetical protein INN71_07880 [Nocardioides sp. ChNu-153]|uniref:hypothetical protein n=1 Tax=unclassified Nocardioides TaxID=2615069 RepID=UPI0024068B85|nr:MULTISPECIES: hypothetical protein [unclassified Nocardioides]MDF9715638.1 hypothetical protein [Nocardioides sp. ChNu-99]MDN7121310.1 hypothetical protein [Nocardioides sp. ChNu-153]
MTAFPDDDLGPAPDVDDVVAALREDPVLVHPLFGNGARDAVDAALTARAEAARAEGVPVYVALVPGVPGLAEGDYGSEAAEELAILLSRQLGDGYYLTATEPHSNVSASLGTGEWAQTYLDYVPGQGDGGRSSLVGDVAWSLDQLAGTEDDPGQYVTGMWQRPDWDVGDDGPSDAFTASFVPALAFVAVGIGVTLLLRNVARWRETAPVAARTQRSGDVAVASPTPGGAGVDSPDGLRALEQTARRELDAVGRRRAERAGRPLDATTRTRVDGSYATAQAVLDSASPGRTRRADLVGALVLARVAAAALDEPGRAPYRPCFVNPLHGRAERTREVTGSGVEVPVCRACAVGAITDPLTVRHGLRRRPYYETGSVWARTGYGALVDDLWSEVGRARAGGGTS